MAVSPTPMQLEYVHDNATERSANDTGKFDLSDWMKILSLILAMVGLVGNSLVLWLLGFRIPRNPFSVYILNLAAADALFLCGTFVSIIRYFIDDSYFLLIDLVLLSLTHMSYTVGLSLLAAISTERCLSVLFPIWYRCNRPRHMSALVCALLWAMTCLLWGTGFVICYYINNDNFCYNFIIIEFSWFSLFTPVLCLSSLALLLRVQCTSLRQQPHRLYLLVLLNVLVFLLCGIPMGIMDIILFWHETIRPFGILQLLACVNSSANPFIYFFLGKQRHKRRRETLGVILQRALEDKQDLGASGEGHPHTHQNSEMSS
ncbi:mas-related G-protein coupled receptor member X1-like [Macrotis lagotis]|uniref:mas-related G-protein coupled receptor member X1-like n=1 Tax=Macrotis lagotis TaxID=92651 RepID=UPI003D691922